MRWDVIIIGGGVTGAGLLRDLALRGIKALLLEKGAPGHGTTVTSTHLIHGGLRYLLYDRLTTHATCWDSGHILRLARPHLTRLPILWPIYNDHRHGMLTVETLVESYDGFQKMKGGLPHRRLTASETAALLPGLKTEGLLGAVSFDEWWVDPVALVEAHLTASQRHGAEVVRQCRVTGLERNHSGDWAVKTLEGEGQERVFEAGAVVNAAGPWADRVAQLAGARIDLRLQKGTHLIYDGIFPWLSRSGVPVGLLLEAADRERYIFMVPGGGMTLVGPTDLPAKEGIDSLSSHPDEIRSLLESARRYFPQFPENFQRTVVGARPILGQKGSEKLLSREFEVFDHGERENLPGFFTVTGGKMSDFRLMGQEAGDAVAAFLGRTEVSRTALETLAGAKIFDIPSFSRPSKTLKKFLRAHPRLREAHALAHLGKALIRHLASQGRRREQDMSLDQFKRYYQETAS